jgi:predicted DNA-binding protein (MmcQ/YjbR family)
VADGSVPSDHEIALQCHWNTATLDGSVSDKEVLQLIDHSYGLAVARLTRAQRNQLIC